MRARFIIYVWALTLTVATCAAAQSAVPPSAPIRPFSGISSITTLDDHDTGTSTTCCSLMQEDAEGRRRTAHIDSADFSAPIRRATITDPVALKLITIDYAAHTAHVTQLHPSSISRISPPDKPFTSQNSDRSDLGEKTTDGIRVHGYEWTDKSTDPGFGIASGTGSPAEKPAQFNPSAYPVINEWWWSPELHLFPLITKVDVNRNKWIQKYEKFDMRAPSPDVFLIPTGFHVTTVEASPSAN